MSFYIHFSLLTICLFQFGCAPKRDAPYSGDRNVITTSTAAPKPKTNPARTRPLKEFTIKIDDVQYSEGQVKVTGSTNLPDGALVIVNFDVAKSPSGDYVGSDERVTVEKGKFKAELIPKKIFPELGGQVVEVMFTPRGQNSKIVDLTGRDGEYLTGNNIKNVDGLNIIEVERLVKLPIR